MKHINEAIDRVWGISPEVLSKIENTVRDLYPDRSEGTIAKIVSHAKDLWLKNDEDLSRAMIANLSTIDPTLTRRTPTIADVVAVKEAEAKRLGIAWGPEGKLSAHRAASAMTDEQRLAAVPADFTLLPQKAATLIAAPTSEEALDAEIERRFGMTPGTARSLSALDRQRYHDALRKEVKPEATAAPLSEREERDPIARIAAARRAVAK
jgi:hypothetical protein